MFNETGKQTLELIVDTAPLTRDGKARSDSLLNMTSHADVGVNVDSQVTVNDNDRMIIIILLYYSVTLHGSLEKNESCMGAETVT